MGSNSLRLLYFKCVKFKNKEYTQYTYINSKTQEELKKRALKIGKVKSYATEN